MTRTHPAVAFPPASERAPRLTPRSIAVLCFVRRYTAARGLSPTLREIGKGAGIKSLSNVSYHVERLRRAGLLTRPPVGTNRGIRLTAAAEATVATTSGEVNR